MKKVFNDLNISDIVKFHPEQLKTIIAQSSSITNILRILGLQATNNNARRRIIRFAKENNIELPIYKFEEASTGKTYIKNREEALKILCKGEIHRGTRIRKIVLKYSLLEYKCQGGECQIIDGMWGSKKITYHLDHINGDNTDNRIENLRFLCPNCHSFTETYGGKNSKNSKKNRQKSSCLKCEKIFEGNFYCNECNDERKSFYQANTPSLNKILTEIGNSSIYYVSKKYFLNRAVLTKIVQNPEKYEAYPRKKANS